MMKIAILAGGAMLWASAAAAVPDAAALSRQVRGNPEGFARTAAGMILGHGGTGGLTADGVARFVAVEQARLRAREAARLLPADLNGDARVTRDEMAAVAGLGDLSARAGQELVFRAADADNDGVATLEEIYVMAEARAASAVNKARSRAEAVLACDRNADGAVRIEEVLETVAELKASN